MKIHSIEVVTDVGRRVIKLGAPLDVSPREGDVMPPHFRSLTELLWGPPARGRYPEAFVDDAEGGSLIDTFSAARQSTSSAGQPTK